MCSKMDRVRTRTSSSISTLMMRPAHFPNDISHEGLRVSEKHQSAIEVVERIIDPCKTRAHAALDDHNRAGFIDVEDRNSVNGRPGFVACRRICHVIRADNERKRRLRDV